MKLDNKIVDMSSENVEITADKQRVVGKPYPKGVSGNPAGRPKGSISIKDKVRQYLETHPQEVEAIVEHFVKDNRELMWQMLEGRPQQDVTSDGKALPTPLLANLNVQNNNSNTEDQPTKEADQGDTGRNISG